MPYKDTNVYYQARMARRKERRAKLDAMKRKCSECGVIGLPPIAYDFHHRDRATKRHSISRLVIRNVSWEEILAEVDKCDVMCSNCHRIVTNR